MARANRWINAASATVVAAGLVASGMTQGVQAAPPRQAPGVEALTADATSPLTTVRQHGRVRFVGAPAHARIDNPGVSRSTGVEAAARAHLKRYGAAIGTNQPGTSLRLQSTAHSVSGQDVVRFSQSIDGVPVLGGGTVVSLRADRDLASLGSSLSAAQSIAAPMVSESVAAAAARTLVGRREGTRDLQVASEGRWVFDPAVFGEPAPEGARTGWRFEVSGPAMMRRLVLIDDRDGRALLDLDENEGVDRVVCDNGGVVRSSDVACTGPTFARTESSGATGATDVDDAFDLSGVVADFYSQVAGLDLTDLLGISTSDGKKLASTVNWCHTGDDCPLENAFWNGQQMYYGAGYAGADDVVGHEMTHGVIDHFSQLFYFGQSGAINESLADVMGEIIDHRHPSPGDTPNDFSIGEDLPGGPIRSLSDPPAYGQPDRMTSPLYTSDVADGYADEGGVHTDSGVGNKTAYLIAHGGTFFGQTLTGIDAGDPESLTKTATLYADVIETLTSGSDYADLAARLDQSCQDLLGAGRAGFTAADCTRVHAATLATQLRTTPTNASQPADAPTTCPTGTAKRVLLDSETGNPTQTFVGDAGWVRGASPYYGANATSGQDSWSITSPWSNGTWTSPRSLTAAVDVAIPAGQATYMSFNSWYLLDYEPADTTGPAAYYDVGTVGLDDRVNGQSAGAYAAEDFPWVNGPNRVPDPSTSYDDRRGFGGDSRGWVTSRVDLSDLGGQTVRPVFTLDTDSTVLFPGWFLDDIQVYTCDWVAVTNTGRPQAWPMGSVRIGTQLQATVGTWAPNPSSYTYQWLRDGRPIPGATRDSYTLGVVDVGHRVSVRVNAAAAGLASGSAVSSAVGPVPPNVLHAGQVWVNGVLRVGKRLRATPGVWQPTPTVSYQWYRVGRVVDGVRRIIPIAGADKVRYRLTRKDRGKRILVQVTARKPGYRTVVVRSPITRKVR